jgi:DMSO/TMAO reductase YedYZ molybdopterin-dependent catalytic subunit
MGERLARWLPRAIVGFGTAAVALAAGEVAAAFVRPEAAPVIAIGNRFVTLTPEWLKAVATRDLGTSDKTVLIIGIYVVIALLALPIGWLAERNLGLGVAAVTAFGALAMYSSLTAAAPKAGDVIPSAVATIAGVVAVVVLQRAAAGWTAGAPTERRAFLLAGAGLAGAVVVGEFAGRAWQRSRFSAASSRAAVRLPTPAMPAPPLPAGAQLDAATPFDTPNQDFYRVDIALRVPQVDADSWQLRIDGMVDQPMTLTFAQLLARPMIERWITIACVSNYVGGDLISTSRFLGTPLAPLLREAGVRSAADQLLTHGKDGATIGVSTAAVLDGRDAMLAVGMNGEPLPIAHGFPVRMVVPGLYGYVSACKWIDRITATTFDERAAYWVARGWDREAPIQLASRIDLPRPGAHVQVSDTITIAGLAWHQHAGIGGVEVKIDDQPWTRAELGPAPSLDTWRQWSLRWTVASTGPHTITVRAVDTDGRLQVAAHRDPYPNAGSGLDSLTIVAR